MKSLPCFAACAMSVLCGCASVPAVTYQYAPATGELTATAVQSLACNKEGTRLFTASAPATITASYHADGSRAPWTLVAHDANSATSDTDLTIERWDDGRLKSINSVSTGQGEAIVKAAVAVAGFVVGSDGAATKRTKLPACKRLAEFAGKDDVVSITFSLRVELSSLLQAAPGQPGPALIPSGTSKIIVDALNSKSPESPVVVAPILQVQIPQFDTVPAVSTRPCTQGSDYCLALQHIKVVTVQVRDQSGQDLGSAQVIVPDGDPARAWTLPIPRPASFGKSTFALSVAESGAVTMTRYAKEAGTAGALNAISSAADQYGPKNNADKLAEMKTKNDLVAETNRTALCAAKPDECK
ncbi:MAG: hypothetical protein WBW32_03835 [Luteibacter sp.]